MVDPHHHLPWQQLSPSNGNSSISRSGNRRTWWLLLIPLSLASLMSPANLICLSYWSAPYGLLIRLRLSGMWPIPSKGQLLLNFPPCYYLRHTDLSGSVVLSEAISEVKYGITWSANETIEPFLLVSHKIFRMPVKDGCFRFQPPKIWKSCSFHQQNIRYLMCFCDIFCQHMFTCQTCVCTLALI